MAIGLRARENKEARKRQKELDKEDAVRQAARDRRQGTIEEREDKRFAWEELEHRASQKRREQMQSEMDMQLRQKRDEAARLMEAEKAFDQWDTGMNQIDWGSADADTSREMLTKQYLPTILKHPSITRKYEAMSDAISRTKAVTNRELQKIWQEKALGEVTQFAPEVLIDPPLKADGTPDIQAIKTLVETARKARADHEKSLREISARGAARSSLPRTLGPGSKAELDSKAAELKTLNEMLLKWDLSGMKQRKPDQYRNLIDRRIKLRNEIRKFDEMSENEPGGLAPPSSIPDSSVDPNDPLGILGNSLVP